MRAVLKTQLYLRKYETEADEHGEVIEKYGDDITRFYGTVQTISITNNLQTEGIKDTHRTAIFLKNYSAIKFKPQDGIFLSEDDKQPKYIVSYAEYTIKLTKVLCIENDKF